MEGNKNDIVKSSLIEDILKTISHNKIKIVLISILGGLLGFTYSYFFAKPKYTANVSFTLEQKSSSIGSLGGIASSLGLGDLPSTTSSGMFGGENILHLLKSNRIIHKSLKESQIDLNGDNLLNEYVRYHLRSDVKEKKIEFFPKNIENKVLSRKQDSILLIITKNIKESSLKAERIDKKTTIINLEITDVNERWAYLFSKQIVKNAIELYLDIKIGKLLKTEQELIQKRDSIRGLLDGSITTLAFETDLNSHTPLMRYKTKQAKKQIDVEVLKNMYASVIQNLEVTKFQRSQESPIIELIDEPIMPLAKKEYSILITTLLGLLISFSITAILLMIVRNLNNFTL
jgi:uncharacterized protein involved in exopolysaccharide biosynthesis